MVSILVTSIFAALVLILLILNFMALSRLERFLGKNKGLFRLRNFLLSFLVIWFLWFLVGFFWHLSDVVLSFDFKAVSSVIYYFLNFLSVIILIALELYIVYLLVKWACLPWWWIILSLIPFVGSIILIYILYRLAKNFGFSWWWTILLVLLFPITFPYVVLKWEYQNCKPFTENKQSTEG
jgi:hypothetical protein